MLIKKIDFYFIIRKVRDFAYEFNSLSLMKIYFIIFITHLEQAIKNKFIKFILNTSSSIIVVEQKHWVVKKKKNQRKEIEEKTFWLNEKNSKKEHKNQQNIFEKTY